MPSAIDDTKPIPLEPTTESVRENFRIAKDEISALQATSGGGPFLPLSGGTIRGDLMIVQPDHPQIAFSLDGIPANSLWLWRDGNSLVLGDDAADFGKFDVAGLVLGRDPAAPPPSNPSRLVVSGADGELAAVLIENFGAVTPRSRIDFRKARGTRANPSAILNNDVLAELRCFGYMTDAYSGTVASLTISASADWTNASTPTQLTIGVNPAGAPNYPLTALTLTGAGDLTIRGNINAAGGTINGDLSVVGDFNGSSGVNAAWGNFGQVILARDPSAPNEAATKQYVDGAVAELRAEIAALPTLSPRPRED